MDNAPDNPYRRRGDMSMGMGRVRTPRTLGLRDLEMVIEDHLERQQEDLSAEYHQSLQAKMAEAWDIGFLAGAEDMLTKCQRRVRLAMSGLEGAQQALRRTKQLAALEQFISGHLTKILEGNPW